MKLVNLVPLKEIDFRNQEQFDDYIKQHELRPDTKVTIAGKVTTAGQAAKNSEPTKGASVFGKDKGGSVFPTGGASTTNTKVAQTPSKYDDKSYWKDETPKNNRGGGWGDDEFGPQHTSNRLNKIEKALDDDLQLSKNGFETTRESSGGGGGGWEGPMTIVSKDADYDNDEFISLSVGSPENDGKFSIVFANANGEPYFEPNYDALTGDNTLEPQQAYKISKALMKMPEVQKVLKGEMKIDEFQPIYDKLKAKLSKGSSMKENHTKLKSLIKRK